MYLRLLRTYDLNNKFRKKLKIVCVFIIFLLIMCDWDVQK